MLRLEELGVVRQCDTLVEPERIGLGLIAFVCNSKAGKVRREAHF